MANLVLNGKSIDSIDDIAENFVEADVLREFQSGSLSAWLDEYGYEDELVRVKAIKPTASNIMILAGIIDALNLDDEVIAQANARREEQRHKEDDIRRVREEQQRKDEEERQRRELEEQQRKDEEERQRRERETQQRKRHEEEERNAREFLLRNETCIETGVCRNITLPGGTTMEMIYCPPGDFLMGSPTSEKGRGSDERQHHVRITKGFWLGKYPISQRQWQSVMGTNPSHFRGDDHPVEMITWNDCQGFIRKVNAHQDCGMRLPTEAEWEYACRAGTITPYSWGTNFSNWGAQANCDRMLHDTLPVGCYASNPWGFYDMHGNVNEWCHDWYADYTLGSVTNPKGPASGDYRVLRGGCWDFSANDCRSASRNYYLPNYRSNKNGVRFCCSVVEQHR